MIHRFVDLFREAEVPWSMIWNIRRQTGGTERTFALDTKGVSTLAEYLNLPSGGDLDKPELSPDLTEYAYIQINGAGVKTDVKIAAADDNSAAVTVAQNPSGAAENPQGGTDIIGWSPDSAQLYYRGTNNNTDDHSEIWVVDRDGSNDTLLWSSSVILNVDWGTLPRISPDGTKIAFWADFDANPNDGLYVMDADGTNDSRIYTAVGSGDFYGWSRDSEWLLFIDNNSGANWFRIFKIRPDGTDQTTIWDTTFGGARPGLSFGQHSVWLPDSSGVLCKMLDGSGVDPDYEVGVLLADGSETFTAFSPQRLMYSLGAVDVNRGPIYGNDGNDRAYWFEGPGTVDSSFVVSALLDGSDFRVEDDMTDSSTTPQHDDYVFLGFHKRTS